MSQAYRMGFQDIARSSDVSRLFMHKYFKSVTGEDILTDMTDILRLRMAETELDWEEELAKVKANLSSHGIDWDEKSQPFITVNGTAQVSKGCDQIKNLPPNISEFCVNREMFKNSVRIKYRR